MGSKIWLGHKPSVPLDTHGHLIKGADAATAEATGSVLKELLKFCGVAAIAWLVFAHLGPTNWQPRTGLGWQIEHFLGYFLVTSIVCLAWPRPFVVGVALMAAAPLLEALQGWIPDRHPNFLAALYGAGGALVAALLSVARNSLH